MISRVLPIPHTPPILLPTQTDLPGNSFLTQDWLSFLLSCLSWRSPWAHHPSLCPRTEAAESPRLTPPYLQLLD